MKNITLDDYVELAKSNEEINKEFLANPILAMKVRGVDFDEKMLIENVSASNSVTEEAPPAPSFEAFWWGYRIRVPAEFLKWISLGGVSVGAVILALAPILLALGPILGTIAAGVVGSLAVYLLTQYAVLIIKANECGGSVCLDALWITPVFWVATCG